MAKPKKPKLVPATVVRHPDGRYRGLALAESDWSRFQFQIGERLIVETHRGDVLTGEVVLCDGGKLVRTMAVDAMDAMHPMFVRRPVR